MRLRRFVRASALALACGWGFGAGAAHGQGWDGGRNMFGFAAYYPGSGWNNIWHPGDGRNATYYTRNGQSFYADPRGRDWRPYGGRYNLTPGQNGDVYAPYPVLPLGPRRGPHARGHWHARR